jgi:uncharacterized protein
VSRVDRVVVLLAKWPGGGRAKRRLASGIGRRRAEALARSFLEDTLALIDKVGADRVVIAYAPPAARERFAALAPRARLVEQPRGGFGTRLRGAIEAGRAAGRRVAVIGADSPTLPASYVRRALDRLVRADAALGPAEDGGYYLIATRVHLPAGLFARMPWSTARVMRETMRRAAEAGLRVAVLPRAYDVDDASDLRRLVRDRAGLARARATRRTLDALRLGR